MKISDSLQEGNYIGSFANISNAGVMGLIPGQGIKISHAMQCRTGKKKLPPHQKKQTKQQEVNRKEEITPCFER